MRSLLRVPLAVILCVAVVAYGQGNSFDRVRYNGGTIPSKVDPKEWHNQLTVTSDLITLKLKDGQSLSIPTSSVTGLSYGQEAHRRVGTMIALAVLVAPVALFGLFHKTRLHFIGIDCDDANGKHAGLLLQGDKDNYRAILEALASSTRQPVAVAEKDREFVPTQVKTTVVKDGEEETANSPSSSHPGSISVDSTPPSADVYLDSSFVGNAPATLKIPAGKHTIRVSLAGYKDWSKEITVLADSEVKLTAALEKN
ncbi:MAG: PEGA domain-containing protein [Candidatus Acidiferrales bacterium]